MTLLEEIEEVLSQIEDDLKKMSDEIDLIEQRGNE